MNRRGKRMGHRAEARRHGGGGPLPSPLRPMDGGLPLGNGKIRPDMKRNGLSAPGFEVGVFGSMAVTPNLSAAGVGIRSGLTMRGGRPSARFSVPGLVRTVEALKRVEQRGMMVMDN